MVSDSDAALEHFARYFEEMLADISPARRTVVARKIGQRLRRIQAKRIAGNVQPDGSPMTPRKKRPREEKRRGRRARMFRQIAKARNIRVRASQDGVELAFANPALGRVAAEHHFGLEGFVGKTKSGRTIRTRYPKRPLLGFGREDIEAITDELLKWLDRD